jgi:hypothetical protein
MKLFLTAILLALCSADDPSQSWLSYAAYTAPNEGTITLVNTTWVVPSNPSQKRGSNAPGWWYGVQTTKGDGALIQPILAYGYKGDVYSIFNACFDWTDQSWHTSPETYTVEPGDVISSYVSFNKAANSYTMYIASKNTGKSISTDYKIERRQTAVESTVYFVLEHQPQTCKAYPADGVCTFENIHVAVDGAVVTPAWKAMQERPACNSLATVTDPNTIKFTWDAAADASNNTVASASAGIPKFFPLKWGAGL